MIKYNIREEYIDEYVKRETKKKMRISSITLVIFLIAMFAFTSSYGVHKILMPPLSIVFLIILGIIYASSLSQIKNIIGLTYFVFSDESISRLLDKEKLNLMNKVGVSRNEHRYGVKFNQTIKFNEIESTSITSNEIIIKSKNYDFFTSNGKISIPKEIENYEVIKSEIINNSNKYKLTQTNV
jgi:hypothetical protein